MTNSSLEGKWVPFLSLSLDIKILMMVQTWNFVQALRGKGREILEFRIEGLLQIQSVVFCKA